MSTLNKQACVNHALSAEKTINPWVFFFWFLWDQLMVFSFYVVNSLTPPNQEISHSDTFRWAKTNVKAYLDGN